MTSPESSDLRDLLDKIIEGKIDTSRRYVDQILEKIQDQHHRYYLEKFVIEFQRMEIEEKAGNVRGAYQHRVMADVYKDILEKTFAGTE